MKLAPFYVGANATCGFHPAPAGLPKVLPSREQNQDAKLDSFTPGFQPQHFQGSIHENNRPTFRRSTRSWNLIENKGSYPGNQFILLKTSALASIPRPLVPLFAEICQDSATRLIPDS
jgi:hypothetical protein